MLSPEVHFPINQTTAREEWLIQNIYKPESKTDWFKYEYKLKDYKSFGINMIDGDASVDDLLKLSPQLLTLLETKNYALDLFNKSRVAEVVDLPYVKFVAISPTTDQGLKWQIRAYAEKKVPVQMHNFTYMNSELINQHKINFGVESWVKVNLYNFYKDAESYIEILKKKSWPTIPLEWLLDSNQWANVVDQLQQIFNIDIPEQSCFNVLDAWNKLHWDYNDTNNWEHVDIFDGFRTDMSDFMIRMHSCQL